jgi:hypothetical protein
LCLPLATLQNHCAITVPFFISSKRAICGQSRPVWTEPDLSMPCLTILRILPFLSDGAHRSPSSGKILHAFANIGEGGEFMFGWIPGYSSPQTAPSQPNWIFPCHCQIRSKQSSLSEGVRIVTNLETSPMDAGNRIWVASARYVLGTPDGSPKTLAFQKY